MDQTRLQPGWLDERVRMSEEESLTWPVWMKRAAGIDGDKGPNSPATSGGVVSTVVNQLGMESLRDMLPQVGAGGGDAVPG